ncbi:MAG TPA: 2-hydroxychromene-2-carboxylate isomerase [Burkholderiaceae bacterium]|nr:2-hydroxychromene-2-carboxylate isomerase [Burkholderiaceae bacterium]
MRHLGYYFWLNSDWAYLGADRLEEVVAKHSVTIHYKPVDLLDVYARTGGIPLSQRSPQRQAYREQELRRWMARLDIHVNITPKHMCPDATLASCFTIAANAMGLPVGRLYKEILAAQWCHEQNVSDGDVLVGVAQRLGLPGRDILARAGKSAVIELYRRYTDEAVAAGVFGSPSYVYEGELFWGQDRLEFLDAALGGVAR